MPRSFAGNISSKPACNSHFHFLWFKSIRFAGGVNSRQFPMVKKMLSIILPLTQRSLLCSTSNKLIPQRRQLPLLCHPHQLKWGPPQVPKCSSKGLTQRQKDLLEALKDEPLLQKAYLQKLMNEDSTASDNASSPASTTKPKICDLQDSQDPYDI